MQEINEAQFVVDADGVLLSAVGVGAKENVTLRSDDSELVSKATRAADLGVSVDFIFGAKPLTAGWDTEVGVLAALLAAAPGRTYVKEAPESVLQKLHELAGPQDSNLVY